MKKKIILLVLNYALKQLLKDSGEELLKHIDGRVQSYDTKVKIVFDFIVHLLEALKDKHIDERELDLLKKDVENTISQFRKIV